MQSHTIKNAEIDLDFPLCKYFNRENITRDTLIIITLIVQRGPTVYISRRSFRISFIEEENSNSFLLKRGNTHQSKLKKVKFE